MLFSQSLKRPGTTVLTIGEIGTLPKSPKGCPLEYAVLIVISCLAATKSAQSWLRSAGLDLLWEAALVLHIHEGQTDQGWNKTLLRNRLGSFVFLRQFWALRNSIHYSSIPPLCLWELSGLWNRTWNGQLTPSTLWFILTDGDIQITTILGPPSSWLPRCGEDQGNGSEAHQNFRELNFEPRYAHEHQPSCNSLQSLWRWSGYPQGGAFSGSPNGEKLIVAWKIYSFDKVGWMLTVKDTVWLKYVMLEIALLSSNEYLKWLNDVTWLLVWPTQFIHLHASYVAFKTQLGCQSF